MWKNMNVQAPCWSAFRLYLNNHYSASSSLGTSREALYQPDIQPRRLRKQREQRTPSHQKRAAKACPSSGKREARRTAVAELGIRRAL